MAKVAFIISCGLLMLAIGSMGQTYAPAIVLEYSTPFEQSVVDMREERGRKIQQLRTVLQQLEQDSLILFSGVKQAYDNLKKYKEESLKKVKQDREKETIKSALMAILGMNPDYLSSVDDSDSFMKKLKGSSGNY